MLRQHGRSQHWSVQVAPGEDEAAAHISHLRSKLLARSDTVAIPDLKHANARAGGTASSDVVPTLEVSWKRLTEGSSTTEWSGRVLYRAAAAVGARSAVEIGSATGLGSCWIASAVARNGGTTLICLDGASTLLAATSDHVSAIAGFRPSTREGVFARTVSALSDELPDESIDLVFVDGEHFYEPTMRDAGLLIPKVREGGIVVFDDISWNDEMERAWLDVSRRVDCAESVEPRHRGSRRLGLFIKGPRGKGAIRVVDDAFGPAQFWATARALKRRLRL